MANPPFTEDLDALEAVEFPAAWASRVRGRRDGNPLTLVEDWSLLSVEDVRAVEAYEAVGAPTLPVQTYTPSLRAIRHTHHRLAQLIASGMKEGTAAKLCNFTPNRVSILKSDPAFAELLAHYAAERDEAFVDFVQAAADLSLDALSVLRERLDEAPESFSTNQLVELVKTTADRSGNSPVQKTHSVNVNLNMGDRLRAARERANAVLIEGVSVQSSGG